MLNALEQSKNMTLCSPAFPGVSKVDDGVVHAKLSLVRKLRWVHGVAHLGPKELQCQSLKVLHNVLDQHHWPVVIERAGT